MTVLVQHERIYWSLAFAIASGAIAGWSLAGLRRREGAGDERGHQWRFLLGLAAIIAFAYSGFVMGWLVGLATLGASLVASGAGYVVGMRRIPRAERQEDGGLDTDSDDP